MRATPLSLLILPALASAQGGGDPGPIVTDRPGIANGAFVVRPGTFQIEAALQRDNLDGERDTIVPFLLRVGAARRFELRFETNGALAVAETGGRSTTGYSPVSVGGKFRLREGSGSKAPAVSLLGRVFPPSGSGAFAARRTQGDLLLVADLGAGPYGFTGNVGIAAQDDGDGTTRGVFLAAGTVSLSVNDRLGSFVDFGLQAPESSGRTQLILDAGFTYLAAKNLQLDLSAGQGVRGFSAPRPFVALGVSYRFR